MRREPGRRGAESARRDETRGRILAVAMDAFARDGFDRTSVRSIARRCGLSDAAVFYYFPTKRHLLEALWNEGPSGEFPRAEPDVPLTPERVGELVIATMRLSARNFTYVRLVAREVLRSDMTATALRNASRARWRQALHEHFASAGPRASDLVEMFMAAVTGYLLRLEIETGDDYPQAVLKPEIQARVARAVQDLIPFPAAASAP